MTNSFLFVTQSYSNRVIMMASTKESQNDPVRLRELLGQGRDSG